VGRRRIVIALGGNALLQRNQPLDAGPQLHNIGRAVDALAPLALFHDLVLTHGNGPQVGLLALESSADSALTSRYPLDALGAETQGLIGYWLAQAVGNALPGTDVGALVTQTVVSLDDPAFSAPTKFIGAVYTEARARELAAIGGWTIAADGTGWRRVVASPRPREIVELGLIEQLVAAGAVVVCAGGGGIPVARSPEGALVGIEAVIDKDLTSALLAEKLSAEALILLTDVAAVSTDITDPLAPAITRATPAELRGNQFAAGSMGPKVDAVCSFVERTGGMAAIGALADFRSILAGTAGTIVTPSGVFP